MTPKARRALDHLRVHGANYCVRCEKARTVKMRLDRQNKV